LRWPRWEFLCAVAAVHDGLTMRQRSLTALHRDLFVTRLLMLMYQASR